MSRRDHIAVLGGGPAGLASAHYARAAGYDVDLFEASSDIGGNCRTIRYGDFRIDTGAHRLHDRDDETTTLARELLGDDLLTVGAPSQIYYDGRMIDFPLAPRSLLSQLPLRTIASIARENVALRLLRPKVGSSFGEVARSTYGATLASIALLGYSRKLWGRDPDELLPSIAGSRLARLDVRSFLLDAFARGPRSRRHLDGSFMYPRFGIGQLFDRLGATLRDVIHTGTPVTRIVHDGARVTRIDAGETSLIDPAHVFNSLPLGITARLLDPAPPASVLAAARALRFRQLRIVVLIIAREALTRNASIYFPDPDVAFTRLYEAKNRSVAMGRPGATAVVLEIPCERGDATWAMGDDELTARTIASLGRLFDVNADEIIENHTFTVDNAYPVLDRASTAHVEHIRTHVTSLATMTLVGRNARFEYSSIHDVFRGAREAVGALHESGAHAVR